MLEYIEIGLWAFGALILFFLLWYLLFYTASLGWHKPKFKIPQNNYLHIVDKANEEAKENG